jgi:hypothetical protein
MRLGHVPVGPNHGPAHNFDPRDLDALLVGARTLRGRSVPYRP